MPDGIATVDEVKAWLTPSGGSIPATADVLIGRLLAVAERRAAEVCNRNRGAESQWGFLTGSKVELLDGDYARSVVLTYTPVTAVASVVDVYAATSAGVESTTTIDMTRLAVDGYAIGGSFSAPDGVLAFRDGSDAGGFLVGEDVAGMSRFWPEGTTPNFGGGFRKIKVTYTGGWAASSFPATLKQAIIELAAWRYKSRGQYPVTAGERNASRDGDRPPDIPDGIWDMLSSYRRMT